MSKKPINSSKGKSSKPPSKIGATGETKKKEVAPKSTKRSPKSGTSSNKKGKVKLAKKKEDAANSPEEPTSSKTSRNDKANIEEPLQVKTTNIYNINGDTVDKIKNTNSIKDNRFSKKMLVKNTNIIRINESSSTDYVDGYKTQNTLPEKKCACCACPNSNEGSLRQQEKFHSSGLQKPAKQIDPTVQTKPSLTEHTGHSEVATGNEISRLSVECSKDKAITSAVDSNADEKCNQSCSQNCQISKQRTNEEVQTITSYSSTSDHNCKSDPELEGSTRINKNCKITNDDSDVQSLNDESDSVASSTSSTDKSDTDVESINQEDNFHQEISQDSLSSRSNYSEETSEISSQERFRTCCYSSNESINDSFTCRGRKRCYEKSCFKDEVENVTSCPCNQPNGGECTFRVPCRSGSRSDKISDKFGYIPNLTIKTVVAVDLERVEDTLGNYGFQQVICSGDQNKEDKEDQRKEAVEEVREKVRGKQRHASSSSSAASRYKIYLSKGEESKEILEASNKPMGTSYVSTVDNMYKKRYSSISQIERRELSEEENSPNALASSSLIRDANMKGLIAEEKHLKKRIIKFRSSKESVNKQANHPVFVNEDQDSILQMIMEKNRKENAAQKEELMF